MKNTCKYFCLFFFLVAIFSCKKKYTSDFIGPQGKEEQTVQIIEPFSASANEVNFGQLSVIPLFFKGKFDKAINWKLTITGDSSGAVKTFIGKSETIDSLTTKWFGEQDSLYYFGRETCTVILSDYFPVTNTAVYNSISMNSNIIAPSNKINLQAKIYISRPKSVASKTFPLFIRKRMPTGDDDYTVGYDPENTCYTSSNPVLSSSEGDPSLILSISDNKKRFSWANNTPLEYSKNGLPINRLSRTSLNDAVGTYSNTYFTLKGTDSFNKDYYIGRIQKDFTFNLASALKYLQDFNVAPEDLYFNVFVYGYGDNAKLNYTLKEDDNDSKSFDTRADENCDGIIDKGTEDWDGTGDDAFEYPITLDFKGWKLFSIKYSDFTQVKDGKNGNGTGQRNPSKFMAVQFSLVAPSKGGSAHVVFDYPTMTIGGPLKY